MCVYVREGRVGEAIYVYTEEEGRVGEALVHRTSIRQYMCIPRRVCVCEREGRGSNICVYRGGCVCERERERG